MDWTLVGNSLLVALGVVLPLRHDAQERAAAKPENP